MLAHVSVDPDGAVTVSIDSDGDQGDAYSSEVLEDVAVRAAKTAVDAWQQVRALRVETDE